MLTVCRKFRRVIVLCGLVLSVAGCNLTSTLTPPESPAPTTLPTPTPTVTPANPDGLTQLTVTDSEFPLESLIAVQIDPAVYTFRVHYEPSVARRLDEWRDRLPSAELIVNANFYDPENRILGLLVADGQSYGTAYTNRGGTFGLLNDQPVLRSSRNGYTNENYSQAVQAFPMLVEDGLPVYNNPQDTQRARRTIIGIDTRGQVVVMVTPFFGLSLTNMSAVLARQPDLQLVHALNLDGGGSTMLHVKTTNFNLASFDPVPAVLAVYRRTP